MNKNEEGHIVPLITQGIPVRDAYHSRMAMPLRGQGRYESWIPALGKQVLMQSGTRQLTREFEIERPNELL